MADTGRGTLTGNRGIIHRRDGTLGAPRWSHLHWIICTLTHPKGRYHGPMPERGWTALFFLDEAVALAAGHRPCAYCRRASYGAYRNGWEAAHGEAVGAAGMDRVLHAARVDRDRVQVRHVAELSNLPDGTFILIEDATAALVLGDALWPFAHGGYGRPLPRRHGAVLVLTPTPSVAVLRAGYRPELHPSLPHRRAPA